MSNYQIEFYRILQPYVEFGYGLANVFLVKHQSWEDSMQGKPYTLADSNFWVYGDLKLDNLGYNPEKN